MTDAAAVSRFRHFPPGRRSQFVACGLPARHFFAHRTYYLPKCGPDALYLAQEMCGRKNLDGHVEMVLFADSAELEQLPREIFFDDDIVWHRQHFGMNGHIAFAYLFVDGDQLYGFNYVSDLVQRISRRREYATRVEKRFHGWRHMLFNSILNFAVERDVRTFHSPASELVMAHTDKARSVKKALFERIYDKTVTERFTATKANGWWVLDIASNRDRLVSPERGEDSVPRERKICICHDIERGLGHFGVDAERVDTANRIAAEALSAMIRCEKAAGVKATYSVLGCLFDDVRKDIESDGHCLAFHSYDHVIRRHWRFTHYYWVLRQRLAEASDASAKGRHANQLYRCRLEDPRIRGFRPPQSRLTAEWDDFNLVLRNFDWCATSSRTLPDVPVMQNGLVKIPIRLDDFPLYKSRMPFREWERRLVDEIRGRDFVAFGLHDCYADLWLSHYPKFLETISKLGAITTLDAIADETILASAM
ncbi:MAG TPA: hypothetical protein VKV24_07620 [Casimicrobiaceae bacterium]|nr:hypothetical protein [Casimicrobiaceae bacterium]